MNPPDRQHQALQTIFSFFLGLMVLAFVGVGVNTFYPSPGEKYSKERQELSRRQRTLDRKAAPGEFTVEEQAQLDSLTLAQDKLRESQQAEMKDWARVTSIILVIFATVVLIVSLGLSEQLRVISNGLLLGGLFTLLYGVGWVIFSGNSVARFWVIVFALLVAIGLGYVKFVRRRADRARAEIETGEPPGGDALVDLAARVKTLEDRAAAAGAALAGGDDTRRP